MIGVRRTPFLGIYLRYSTAFVKAGFLFLLACFSVVSVTLESTHVYVGEGKDDVQ